MNIKKLILGTVVALSPGLALAADLPARKAAPAPLLAAAPFSWSGFYAGLNAGFGVLERNTAFSAYNSGSGSGSGVYAAGVTKNGRGVLGGAQVGYNQQFGSLVLGVEADIVGTSMKGTATHSAGFSSGSGSGTGTSVNSGTLSALGTVRARAGVAVDKALFYVTGGLAYGRVRNSLTVDLDSDFYSFNQTKWKYGWAAGAGMEYAVNRNWSVKAEAIYFDLGKTDFSYESGDFAGRIKNSGLLGRMGLNYRF